MRSFAPASKDLRKIYSGSMIAFIGMLINSGAQYFLIVIMGRFLGPADVGLFFLGRAIMKFANTGGTFGIAGSISKFVPEYLILKKNDLVHKVIRFSFLSSFLVSLTIGIILYYITPFLCTQLFGKKDLIPVLRLFSICLPAFSMMTLTAASIRAFRNMIAYSIVENIISPAGVIVITLVLFIYSRSVQSVVIADILSLLIAIGVGAILLIRMLPVKHPDMNNKLEIRRIVNYSVPFMGSDYLGLSLLWMDTFMLGIFMNAEAVGVYNGAIKIALFSKIILTSINSIFGPTISKLYAKGDLTGIEAAYKSTVRWIVHISFPFFLIIFLFSEQIMGLYGAQFVDGAPALIILSLGQLVSLSVGSAGSILNMTGRPQIEFLNRTAALILNFFLNWYLIPVFGIAGAALATAASTSLVNIMRLVENYRYLNIHPFSMKIIYPFYKSE